MLTLAPEQIDASTIKRLAEAGIILFAGHSDASMEEMAEAALNGLSGVTHLFNACSQIAARTPGIVGAALTNPRLFAGIIADGHHVHDANLQLAVLQMENRLCLVTDTMPSYGATSTEFMLAGQKITLKDGKLSLRLVSWPGRIWAWIRRCEISCSVALCARNRRWIWPVPFRQNIGAGGRIWQNSYRPTCQPDLSGYGISLLRGLCAWHALYGQPGLITCVINRPGNRPCHGGCPKMTKQHFYFRVKGQYPGRRSLLQRLNRHPSGNERE